MNITSARNPQWADAAHTHINLLATFDTIGEVPFSASASDLEPHGVLLFNEASAGTFGVIAAYVPPVTPPVTEADYTQAVQDALDAKAKAFGYDGILSAVTYADDPTVPLFQHQGQALRAWRSQVWASCYATLAAVQAGTQTQPTIAELVASLPIVTVPTT